LAKIIKYKYRFVSCPCRSAFHLYSSRLYFILSICTKLKVSILLLFTSCIYNTVIWLHVHHEEMSSLVCLYQIYYYSQQLSCILHKTPGLLLFVCSIPLYFIYILLYIILHISICILITTQWCIIYCTCTSGSICIVKQWYMITMCNNMNRKNSKTNCIYSIKLLINSN
jgi:hypothetical protein